MAGDEEIPPLPWATSREARRAAHAERRREHREARELEREAKRDAKRQRSLDPSAIVDAAIRILDTEGLEALTIRRLAAELGAGVMTLYWYVQNKDEVLDLVADRVTAEVEVPPATADWRDQAKTIARSLRQVLLRHPAAVPIMNERPTLGPNALGLMDVTLGLFRRAGFSDEDASDAYFTLSSYVEGFSTWQTAMFRLADRPGMSRQEFLTAARDYVARLPADRYPDLVPLAPQMFGGTADDRFEFGLEVLLGGLARRLAVKTAG